MTFVKNDKEEGRLEGESGVCTVYGRMMVALLQLSAKVCPVHLN
jgi:hypothetical protein